ncbi:hypothetical protein Syun_029515 [Stephania yunnanensis]|uniref:Uncharacterized protein n=1 Tax=Stephania yunnanensis TaxID=152371 RepID=A0AAP0HJX7_9MAGN
MSQIPPFQSQSIIQSCKFSLFPCIIYGRFDQVAYGAKSEILSKIRLRKGSHACAEACAAGLVFT